MKLEERTTTCGPTKREPSFSVDQKKQERERWVEEEMAARHCVGRRPLSSYEFVSLLGG